MEIRIMYSLEIAQSRRSTPKLVSETKGNLPSGRPIWSLLQNSSKTVL